MLKTLSSIGVCAITAFACATSARVNHAAHHTAAGRDFVVTTSSSEAERAMDEGMKWIYGFNHEEAVRSFQRAASLDPKLAMAHWGIALALGPNINLDVDPEREKQAYEEAQKAVTLAANVTPRERAYIDALARRYSIAADADLKRLSVDYSNAMREVMRAYPDDLDAATLWAESAMDLRPWKLWNADGTPAEGTNEIVEVLQSVLQRDPNHVGANHYYIHAVEASPDPARALASAGRLPALAPDAGHLVHMPAHILMRTGDYNGAAVANERAAAVDRKYIAKHGGHGIYPMMYYNHNLDFLSAARAMEGRFAESKKAADMLHDNVAAVIAEMPDMAAMAEPFLTRPAGVLLRFGRWEELLSLPQPAASLVAETSFWHYARGMAYAAKGNVAQAQEERRALAEWSARVPAEAMFGLNPTPAVLAVASALLDARIARAADPGAEVGFLRTAVERADALAYDEPPDFYYPVRESLGGALLRAGRPSEAERVFREDLTRNPNNPRSLFGLAESLEAQKQPAATERHAFEVSWKDADTRLTIADL